MNIKKTIAILMALSLALSLTACGRPGVEIDWSSSSIAARVDKVRGSVVTLTLGVIDTSTDMGGSTGSMENANSDTQNQTGGTSTPEGNPADMGGGENAAENSGTGEAGPESASGEASTGNSAGSMAQQQENAGGVSFGDGGAAGDYQSPVEGNYETTEGGEVAGEKPENNTAGQSGETGTPGTARGRFIPSGSTIRITVNDSGLLSMLGEDGSSSEAKLSDLKEGDIVTLDHNSKGILGGIVLRRDLALNAR